MDIKRLMSGKGSPIFSYGLLIVAVILWYALAWEPLSAKRGELELTLQTKDAEIGRLQRELQRHRGVDQRLKQVRRELSVRKGELVPGKTPQLVASNLQDSLLNRASELKVDVVTYKTAPVRKWKDYQLAAVTFTFKTQTSKLVQFLKQLEEDRRAMHLQSLNVVKVPGREPHLRVTVEAEALYLAEVEQE